MEIKEYRKLLNDDLSSDEQIQKRLDYLEALCRNVIEMELEKHLSKSAKRGLERVKVGEPSNRAWRSHTSQNPANYGKFLGEFMRG